MANEFSRFRVAKASYNFAVDGGAIATIIPSISDEIPIGAIITDVTINTTVAVTTGGSPTIAITGGGVTLSAAATLANSELDDIQVTRVIRAGQGGASGTAPYIPIIATASAQIAVVVATAALTAGTFDIYVSYLL